MRSGSGCGRSCRSGVHWRDLPERFGPWKTVYERHRLWSADGTWERLLQQAQAQADAAGEVDWGIAVDSTIVRTHHHAAGARNDPPPTPSKGAESTEQQDESETPRQSLLARLEEVVQEVRAWVARAAASATSSTWAPTVAAAHCPWCSPADSEPTAPSSR